MLSTRVAAAVALGAVALVGTACSTSEGGQASPQTGSTQQATTAESSHPSSNGTPLAAIQPCSLLTADDLSKYGTFPEGSPDNVDYTRGCKFQKDRESPTDAGRVVSVDIREKQGIGDINGMGKGVDHTEANGRKLAQVPGEGLCMIAIGVTESSRVDINVTATEGTNKSCNIADEIAVQVESKLPQN